MANLFTVSTGVVASPSNGTKVAVQLATTATNTPIRVSFARETGASSVSGSAPTPVLAGGDASVTASTTARISDTTDGASPTEICSWYVPPTSGFSYQFPLGREISMKISDFVALRIITVTGSGTPNYVVNLWFEE
jgi:hypothetical protein